MDLIKDLLISAFFDAALAILWVGALAIAWRRTRGFVREPLKTTGDEVRSFWSKVKEQNPSHVVYMVIPLVISFYLVGTVMQRISDDFVETTSSWMPKPTNLTKLNEFKLEVIGTDDAIREDIIQEYRHFVAQDDELIKLNEHWRKEEKGNGNARKKMDKVIRDSRTRRAFSDSGSGSYMQRLLEPVRICQATLMHSFLLSFILFSLAVVIGANQLCRRPRSRLFAFWGWTFALLAWTGFLAPTLHDPKEYNFPVLFVFTIILVPLVATGKKILLGQEEEEAARRRRDEGFRPVYQLLLTAGAALIFCYWSTFSWAEHRTNFVEAALVLGGGPSDATMAATPPSGSAAAVMIQVAELSGSAVFQDGLLIADDELIGMVLHVPGASDTLLDGKLLKIARRSQESQPTTDHPKLAAVQDFEGIASDGAADLFFVGSHHPKEGKRRPDREFLLQARWEEGELRWSGEYRNLPRDLEAPFKEIGISLGPGETIHPELNAEGLAWHENELHIGLRAPLAPDGRAIIASTDAMSLFQSSQGVKLKLRLVPLNGAGIRSLDWDPKTAKMLILSGPTGEEQTPRPALWAHDMVSGRVEAVHTFTDEELKASNTSGGRSPEGASRWNDKIAIVFDNDGKELPGELLYLDWP